jgi:hypothetical protein
MPANGLYPLLQVTVKEKTGTSILESIKLVSGLPQIGILSPLIIIIYGADIEEWITHLRNYNLFR